MTEPSLGVQLRGVHADEALLAKNLPPLRDADASISLTSSWFIDGGTIPNEAAGPGVGGNISPPLSWSNAPLGTDAYLLLMEDPDAPVKEPWVHFTATKAKGRFDELAEGALAEPLWTFGFSTGGTTEYAGPRAIPDHGPHRYFLTLIALSEPVILDPKESLPDLLGRIAKTVRGYGVLVGIFER